MRRTLYVLKFRSMLKVVTYDIKFYFIYVWYTETPCELISIATFLRKSVGLKNRMYVLCYTKIVLVKLVPCLFVSKWTKGARYRKNLQYSFYNVNMLYLIFRDWCVFTKTLTGSVSSTLINCKVFSFFVHNFAKSMRANYLTQNWKKKPFAQLNGPGDWIKAVMIVKVHVFWKQIFASSTLACKLYCIWPWWSSWVEISSSRFEKIVPLYKVIMCMLWSICVWRTHGVTNENPYSFFSLLFYLLVCLFVCE